MGRRRDTEFLSDLHRDDAETYTVEFLVGDWGGCQSIIWRAFAKEYDKWRRTWEPRRRKIGLRKVDFPPNVRESGKRALSGVVRRREK